MNLNASESLPIFNPSIQNIVIITVLTIIVLITILGNLIVLLAFMFEAKLRKEAFNYFIVNLAITDFLVAITAMTFYTIDTVLGYWPFGPGMCAFWIYADYAMTFASVFTLSAISVDRFWSVTWPIHYRVHSTVKKTLIMIGIVWACVFIIWTPPFIGDRLKHNEMYTCIWEPDENREFIIVVDIIGHYLPCALMVISYIKVFTVMRNRAKVGPGHYFRGGNSSVVSRSVRVAVSQTSDCNTNTIDIKEQRHKRNDWQKFAAETSDHLPVSTHVSSSSSKGESSSNFASLVKKVSPPSKQTQNNKNKREDMAFNKLERTIFITLSYVIICYLICWFPFYVTWDIYAFHPNLVPPLLYTIMFWMTYINSTLNPLIYAYTNKDFRRTFIRILKCQCKKRTVH